MMWQSYNNLKAAKALSERFAMDVTFEQAHFVNAMNLLIKN
jgi:hypothetical protein